MILFLLTHNKTGETGPSHSTDPSPVSSRVFVFLAVCEVYGLGEDDLMLILFVVVYVQIGAFEVAMALIPHPAVEVRYRP